VQKSPDKTGLSSFFASNKAPKGELFEWGGIDDGLDIIVNIPAK